MRKWSLFIIFGLVLTVFSQTYAKTYSIELFSGTVKVSKDGGKTWKEPMVDMQLQEKDMVQTGNNSYCEIKMPDRGIFRISYNTTITLSSLSAKSEKISMKKGNILLKIFKPLEADETFQVESDVAVAAVRGTSFQIESDGEEQTVSVANGQVAIVRNVNIPASSELLAESMKKDLEIIATADEELTVTAEENRALEQLMAKTKNMAELRKVLRENRTFTEKKKRALKNARHLIESIRAMDPDDDSEEAQALDDLIDKVRNRD